MYLSIYLSVCLAACLSIYLSIYLYISTYIYIHIYIYIYIIIYIHHAHTLSAPPPGRAAVWPLKGPGRPTRRRPARPSVRAGER